jgi:methylthioribose-1-phosphate isomerase
MVLEAIRYSPGKLDILDQLQLPHNTHFDSITSSTDAWHAIKSMRTRGAPAIAIVAALSLAVELANTTVSDSSEEVKVFIEEKLDYLITSRPTAVNLADAAFKLKKVVEDATGKANATGHTVRAAYIKAAEQMLVDDVSDNEAIGGHGAEWILKNTEHGGTGKVSVLTHCNTGYVAMSTMMTYQDTDGSYTDLLPQQATVQHLG